MKVGILIVESNTLVVNKDTYLPIMRKKCLGSKKKENVKGYGLFYQLSCLHANNSHQGSSTFHTNN